MPNPLNELFVCECGKPIGKLLDRLEPLQRELDAAIRALQEAKERIDRIKKATEKRL